MFSICEDEYLSIQKLEIEANGNKAYYSYTLNTERSDVL
jgi:hypothetical protein